MSGRLWILSHLITLLYEKLFVEGAVVRKMHVLNTKIYQNYDTKKSVLRGENDLVVAFQMISGDGAKSGRLLRPHRRGTSRPPLGERYRPRAPAGPADELLPLQVPARQVPEAGDELLAGRPGRGLLPDGALRVERLPAPLVAARERRQPRHHRVH